MSLSDLAGQERYRSMSPLYYRGSQIALVGFAVNDRESFDTCDGWISELMSSTDCVIVAVGNKIDVDRKDWKVSSEEAREHFCSTTASIPYFETSAKTGEGVNEAFEGAVRAWIESGGITKLQAKLDEESSRKGVTKQNNNDNPSEVNSDGGLFKAFKKAFGHKKDGS